MWKPTSFSGLRIDLLYFTFPVRGRWVWGVLMEWEYKQSTRESLTNTRQSLQILDGTPKTLDKARKDWTQPNLNTAKYRQLLQLLLLVLLAGRRMKVDREFAYIMVMCI